MPTLLVWQGNRRFTSYSHSLPTKIRNLAVFQRKVRPMQLLGKKRLKSFVNLNFLTCTEQFFFPLCSHSVIKRPLSHGKRDTGTTGWPRLSYQLFSHDTCQMYFSSNKKSPFLVRLMDNYHIPHGKYMATLMVHLLIDSLEKNRSPWLTRKTSGTKLASSTIMRRTNDLT